MSKSRLESNQPKFFSFKRLSRYGIRTLLLLITVCASLLGYWNWKYAPIVRAVNRLESEGLYVEYDDSFAEEISGFESWMYRLSGISTAPNSVVKISGYTEGGLDGFECFSNLKNVELTGPNISDLTPLQELRDLRSFKLYSCERVNDIEPLRHCKKMELVHLVGTGVSDISALAGLSNLTEIGLERSPVKDIQALAGLSKLKTLYLKHTKVESLLALKNLTNVDELFLEGSQVKSLQGVEKLIGVTELNLEGTLIRDLEPLNELQNLEGLILVNTPIENLDSLPPLPNIAWLVVGGERFKSLSGLAKAMPKEFRTDTDQGLGQRLYKPLGVSITLMDCPIAELSELGSVSSLERVTLESITAKQLPKFKSQDIQEATFIDVPISNFDSISKLPLTSLTIESPSAHFDSSFLAPLVNSGTLEEIRISDASIGDLAVFVAEKELPNFSRLEMLELPKCDVMNFEALSKLTGLMSVTLDDTELQDVEWAAGLHFLTYLSIANTRVSNLGPLAKLRLETLNLSGCPIGNLDSLHLSRDSLYLLKLSQTGIQDLDFLRSFTSLDRLDISDTNITDLSLLIETQQPASLLQMAGVTLDEPGSINKLTWLGALDISGTNVANPEAFNDYSRLEFLAVQNLNIDLVTLRKRLPNCDIRLNRTEDDWYPFSAGLF